MTRSEYRAAARARGTGDTTLRAAIGPDARAFERELAPVRVRNVDPIVRPFDRAREHPVRQTVRQWAGRPVDKGECYAA